MAAAAARPRQDRIVRAMLSSRTAIIALPYHRPGARASQNQQQDGIADRDDPPSTGRLRRMATCAQGGALAPLQCVLTRRAKSRMRLAFPLIAGTPRSGFRGESSSSANHSPRTRRAPTRTPARRVRLRRPVAVIAGWDRATGRERRIRVGGVCIRRPGLRPTGG